MKTQAKRALNLKASVFSHSLVVPGRRQMSLTALNATPTSSTPLLSALLLSQRVERAWRSRYPHVYDQVFLSASFQLSSLASPSSPTKFQCWNWNKIHTSRSIEFQSFMMSFMSPLKNFGSSLRGWSAQLLDTWAKEPRNSLDFL